jgi:preprotein translocase subunit SecG
MRRFLFQNSLSLFFGALFMATLVGQSFAGQRAYNAEQVAHGEPPIGWIDYVFSPSFGGAVMENWQSEFLQFTTFILATVWLVQKGSNESKPLGDVGLESKQKQKLEGHAPANAPPWAKVAGARRILYENSLVFVMTAVFFATWLVQSLSNWRTFNADQLEHDEQTISWGRYLLNPDFWERTLQNWQSEFLAVGTMAVFTIYLRQRGSPESKPVGAAHEETGSSG